MQVKLIRHISDRRIIPMLVVSDDPKATATAIINSSDECVGIKPKLEIEKVKSLDLDPGGMYFTKTQHLKFDIDGVTCDIQATKIDWVLEELEDAREIIPGFHQFRMWIVNIILPTAFMGKLKEKLTELRTSSEALHAQLDEEEVLTQLEASRDIVRLKLPRETQ